MATSSADIIAPSNLAAVKVGVNQEHLAELIRLGQDIHLKRCHESQRRYRKKQNDKLLDLETATVQLRVEVARLEKKRADLFATIQRKANMWNMVVEYLWLFRHGLQLQRQLSQDTIDAQLDFVHKAIAADVACNDGFGQTATIRSWWFLQWFGDVEVELKGLEKITNNSPSTMTQTVVTITEQTLQKLFPHLSSEAEGDWAHKIARKLVGQRISTKGSVYFEFDEHSGHVTSIIAQSDMLTPMLRLLGNLAYVSLAFDKALISPNFQWKRRTVKITP